MSFAWRGGLFFFFFAWCRNLVKNFGKLSILFLIYGKTMFQKIGVALSLWLGWWAKNLLSNSWDWCLSASCFEGNEYICEYIHFAMIAKWKKKPHCYQTTSGGFFYFIFLSQLCLIQHSRNFLECQRKLEVEFLRVFFCMHNKREEFLSCIIPFWTQLQFWLSK